MKENWGFDDDIHDSGDDGVANQKHRQRKMNAGFGRTTDLDSEIKRSWMGWNVSIDEQ